MPISVSSCDLTPQLQGYRKDGFTVFRNLYGPVQMHQLREKHAALMADEDERTWFGNMLEYAPKLMWPAVSHPVVLDFLEQVMGPFIQLDNLTLAAFPAVSKEEARGKVSEWHRDRWAHMPHQNTYTPPLASNAICYLQDLTDEFGPLRIIPGSHRRPVGIPGATARTQPHTDEVLLHMAAGDVVVTHNGLIHSGSPNTSGHFRYFFSVYYNSSWLKYTDNHNGPRTQQLLTKARNRNDYRLMRLLGDDPQLPARCNSGFLIPDEQRWGEWIDADREALNHTPTS